MLVGILQLLPKDALVYESRWSGIEPIDRTYLEPRMGPLLVYERDGDCRLFIDDGEASHDTDAYTGSLFWAGGALRRAIELAEKTDAGI